MRALVISDMAPDDAAPGRGVFVRDQVAALRRLPGLEVELDEAPPGAAALAALAARCARRRGFDVVHAHYGLSAWPALAVRGARRAVTLHGTDLRHPRGVARAAPRGARAAGGPPPPPPRPPRAPAGSRSPPSAASISSPPPRRVSPASSPARARSAASPCSRAV